MILLYHKVDLSPRTMWWVSVDAFERQMSALSDRQVVTLDEYDHSNPDHVVISFDGVYADILRYAAPTMRRRAYPFELFVVGDTIGQSNWFDVSEPPARFASLSELDELVALGARLQWHTASHADPATLDDAALDRELTVDPALRAKFGAKHFRWFAYPHGRVDARTAARVQQHFAGAVACDDVGPGGAWGLPRKTVVENTRLQRNHISLIVPNYNYGAYVGQAIESALAQTSPADEILVIDDASTDGSLDIIDNYRGEVRVEVNETNLGIVECFRKAVNLTRGEYIAFLGADNRLRCDFIQCCRELLDANPRTAIAFTDVALFGPLAPWKAERLAGHPYSRVSEAFGDTDTGERVFWWCFQPPPNITAGTLVAHNFIHGSSMYRRAAYEEVGGYRSAGHAEDKDLFARMVEAGWRAAHARMPLLEYRQHSAEQANTAVGLELAVTQYRAEIARLRRRIAELERHANAAPPQ